MSGALHIRVVAPANTMADLPAHAVAAGIRRLESLDCQVSFGRHVNDRAGRIAGSTRDRARDLADALADPSVGLVMSAWGGYNSNELLPLLIPALPGCPRKAFIGYSDVTALLLGFYRRAPNLSLLHGPSFSTFCWDDFSPLSARSFTAGLRGLPLRCTSRPGPLPDSSGFVRRAGWHALRPGRARGPAAAGNLETIAALAGTPYAPDLASHVLFIEDATGANPGTFRRDLTHLRQTGMLDRVAGLVVGRFPAGSALDQPETLDGLLREICDDADWPIFSGVECGHTQPMLTIPLGSTVEISGAGAEVDLTIGAR